MPTIAKTSTGTPYKREDSNVEKKLKDTIRKAADEARKFRKAGNEKKEAHHKARLKFIAISIYQNYYEQNKEDVEKLRKKLEKDPKYKDQAVATVIAIEKHIARHDRSIDNVLDQLERYIDLPTDQELDAGLDTLFPKKTSKKKAPPSPPRIKTSFEKGLTPSLAAPPKKKDSANDDKLSDDEVVLNDIERCADHIEEHARRRVELFFLLCVALHNQHRVITIDDTKKQHGKGAAGSGYHACHSSLFTSIADKSAERETRSSSKDDVSILEEKHFTDVLNQTMELPSAVNRFDSVCEGKNADSAKGLRKKLQPTLQQVSDGKQSPIEAMATFFLKMSAFFDGAAKDYAKKSTTHIPSNVRERIRELEEEGTFYWTDKTKERPSDEAIFAWLRVPTWDRRRFFSSADPLAEEYYEIRQEEILSPQNMKKIGLT